MKLNFEVLGLDPNFVDYQQAWDLQQQTHAAVLAGQAANTVYLLEHASVYTAGKRTEPQDLPTDGSPVVNVDRGGKLTWHGPGQLVGYPIVRLKSRGHVRSYVDYLEKALISVIADYGIETVQIPERSGVWVPADANGPDRKIAAIGLRVHKNVCMHGFALNCSNSLEPYEHVIACGITDAGTTTISAEAGRIITPTDVLPAIKEALNTGADEHIAEEIVFS